MSGRTVFRLMLASVLIGAVAGPAAAERLPEAPMPRPVAPAEAPMPRAVPQTFPFELSAGTFKLLACDTDCALGSMLKPKRGLEIELSLCPQRGLVVELTWTLGAHRGIRMTGCCECPPGALANVMSSCAISNLAFPCAISDILPPCGLFRVLVLPGESAGSFLFGVCAAPPAGVWGCIVPTQAPQRFLIELPRVLVKETGTGTFLVGVGCAGPCPQCGFVQAAGHWAAGAQACGPVGGISRVPMTPIYGDQAGGVMVRPFMMAYPPPAMPGATTGVKVVKYEVVEPCPLRTTAVAHPAHPLLGTWYRELPGMVIAVTFAPDELTLRVTHAVASGEGATITITAHYTLTKDGLVYGAVTGADLETGAGAGGLGADAPIAEVMEVFSSMVDCPFSFRMKMTSAGLMVSGFKLGGKLGADSSADKLSGMLRRSKDGTVPAPKPIKNAAVGVVPFQAYEGPVVLPSGQVCVPPPVVTCPGPNGFHPAATPVQPCPAPHGFAPAAPMYPGVYVTPVPVNTPPTATYIPIPPPAASPYMPAGTPSSGPMLPGQPGCPNAGALPPPLSHPVVLPLRGEPVCPPAATPRPVQHCGACSALSGEMNRPVTWTTGLPPTPMKQMAADAFDQLLMQHGVITPTPCPQPMPVAAASNVAAVGVQVGTWHRDLGSRRCSVTFAPDHLSITISMTGDENGKPIAVYLTLTADYCMARDGVTVLGLITGIDARFEGAWDQAEVEQFVKDIAKCQKAAAEQPFAMKVRVYGGALVIGDMRLPETLEDGDLSFQSVAGRYTKATEKPVPAAPAGRLSLLSEYASDPTLRMQRLLETSEAMNLVSQMWRVVWSELPTVIQAGHRAPSFTGGLTLPPHIAPAAPFPLPRELVSMEEGAAGRIGAILPVPLLPVPTEPGVPAMPEPTPPVLPMPQPVKPNGYDDARATPDEADWIWEEQRLRRPIQIKERVHGGIY